MKQHAIRKFYFHNYGKSTEKQPLYSKISGIEDVELSNEGWLQRSVCQKWSALGVIGENRITAVHMNLQVTESINGNG